MLNDLPRATMKTPPTLKQVEDYCQEKNWYLVDAKIFWDYFEANEWHDKGDAPVKRWKGKIVTWHYREKRNLESMGVKLSCRSYGCKNEAPYCVIDDTGQKTFWCKGHNPIPKSLPTNIVPIMKGVPEGDKRPTSDKVNEARRKLGAK